MIECEKHGRSEGSTCEDCRQLEQAIETELERDRLRIANTAPALRARVLACSNGHCKVDVRELVL